MRSSPASRPEVAGWVDSHCHLHMSEEPAALLLDRASGAGVEWVVDPGTDAASSAAAIELGRQFPAKVFPAVGLHPHDAERWDAERSEIERMAPQAVAIGECGLDFYRNLSSPDAQIAAFRGQIDLAEGHPPLLDRRTPLDQAVRRSGGDVLVRRARRFRDG